MLWLRNEWLWILLKGERLSIDAWSCPLVSNELGRFAVALKHHLRGITATYPHAYSILWNIQANLVFIMQTCTV